MANGDRYEGYFHEGQRHGQGKHEIKDSLQVYDGEWNDGLPHGQGREVNPAGDVYNGGFNEGKKHGRGKLEKVD